MFTLTISCVTTSNLSWFMDLTFQLPMQYCSLQNQTLLSPPDTSTTEHRFHFGPVTSFFLEVLVIALQSSAVAYWTPSNLGGLSSGVISFCLFILFMVSCCNNTEVVCHFLLQGTAFCQNSPQWPVHLGQPCMACLIASLSYASAFSMTRLWSMKQYVPNMTCQLLVGYYFQGRSACPLDRVEAAILEGFIKERIFKKYIEVQIEVFCCCCCCLCGKGVVLF